MARHTARPQGRYRRALATLALALIAASTLAACASSGSGGAAAGQTNLSEQTWVVPQDWGALDPTAVAATNTGAILLVMEPLVLSRASGGVAANLAEQSNPDPRTYLYTLRHDAKFSDGNPVTMEDVVYSFQIHAAMDSKSTLAGKFKNVASMRATGTDQFTIKLKSPDVLFEDTVARVGIVEKSVREGLGGSAGSPDKPNVGSGPFMVDKYEPGSRVVLKANPNYWGEKPKVKKLTLRVIADDSARLLAVQSDDVTGAFEVPAAEADAYGSASGMKLISGANPSIMMLNVNTTKAPWNDVHVRRAVTETLDKQGIVDAVLKGRGDVQSAVVNAQNMGDVLDAPAFDSLVKDLATKHDVDAAKAELALSKTPTGFSGQLVYSDVEASSGLVAQAVASQLKDIGIDLKVKATPDSQYTDGVFFNHSVSAAIVDFTTDVPDPISLPNYLTSSAQTLAAGGYTNIAEWSSPAQDKVLADYLSTPSTDRIRRGELLTEALRNMAADQPYIPIYNSKYLAVVKSGLRFADFDGMWWMRRWVDEVTTK